MQRIFAERILVCHSPLEILWARLADTDRLNQSLGLAPIALKPIHSPSGARFRISTALAGIPTVYDELPTIWAQQEYFIIRREMLEGPLKSLELRFGFRQRKPEGSLVDIRISAECREGIPGAALQLELDQLIQAMAALVRRLDVHPQHLIEIPPELELPLNREALNASVERLSVLLAREGKAQSPALAQALAALVTEDDPRSSFQLRPYAVAPRLTSPAHPEGLTRREVLELFLFAVDAGMLELQWALVCQSCRGVVSELPSLEKLEDHADCPFCELRFSTTLEDSVEAVFRPVRAIRPKSPPLFCMAGPARSPHVFSQGIVEGLSKLTLPVPPVPGEFTVSARGGLGFKLETTVDGPEAQDVVLTRPASDKPVRLVPGGRLSVISETPEARHVRVERCEWVRQAATVRDLCLLPHFRRTFSGQLLRPGLTVRVGRMTVLFSDLSNSTQLYQRLGDAAAFRFVYDHFEVLERCIQSHQGALIKTSGDAVMAVFEQELEGLGAALDMLTRFRQFQENYVQTHPECQIAHLKLGVHTGTCYLVSDRARLDYFGQIVNVAARLQGEAHPDELVVDEGLAALGLRNGCLKPEQVGEHYTAHLKGVEPPMAVVRIRGLATPVKTLQPSGTTVDA